MPPTLHEIGVVTLDDTPYALGHEELRQRTSDARGGAVSVYIFQQACNPSQRHVRTG